MMTVHGEELEETFPLTAVLKTHHSNVVDNDVGMLRYVHFLDRLGHDAVVPEVLHVLLSVLFGRRVGNDHQSLGFYDAQQSPQEIRLSHVALTEKQNVLLPLLQRR